ncbi:hypothetical protein GGI23_000028 [Coemansia sp. RSA 2559]|nr:hypothetical protein GGI23_000028 [Coemansia sp. RSA 2559]KAJ2869784.1 hypothetical protein GGI22_000026 [Coemansia erecta]
MLMRSSIKFSTISAALLLLLLPLPLALCSPAAASAISPAKESRGSSGLGNASVVVCQLNKDRHNRYELPVFEHQTLNQAAEILGTRYAGGTFNNSLFDSVFQNLIQPLGPSVSASYKILGSFSSDLDYVSAIERTIYSSLFARNLQAIGLYERQGVYTVVLASSLENVPSTIDPCPVSPSPPYQPPSSDPARILNGIDLPSFLCAVNAKRTSADTAPFTMHRALESEALEQANQMVQLGSYTVDGPRKVDQAIYGANVAVKKLYWFAGDRYTGATELVNLLMASYADTLLDPNYSVIGVAQKGGFWSVILAQLYRTPTVKFSCPLSLNEIEFTS